MATSPIKNPTPAGAIEATTKLLRAGWHPIQIEALTILVERGVASPKEIAVELGLTKAKAGYVSHHCKELVKKGLAELDHTEPRRGASEHFYKALVPLVVLDEDAERMSFEERLQLTCWIAARISHDLITGIESGTIDERIDRHLTRQNPLRLDEQGYEELIEEQNRQFFRIEEIKARAAERLDADGEDGLRIAAFQGCYPLPNGVRRLDQ